VKNADCGGAVVDKSMAKIGATAGGFFAFSTISSQEQDEDGQLLFDPR
jgi:hypothetical protein